MKPIITPFILSVFVLLVTALPLLAHEGHQHKVMGNVAVIDQTHIEVNVKNEGYPVSVQLNLNTKYQKGDEPAVLADVKVGQKVVVTYSEDEGQKMAHTVRLPADKKKTK